jgi:diaminohydroxyphosphoribosylaminopyrimidine deaminase/5-amino-6-(5-phosphoribosylamino)uracil reductase
MQEVDNIKFMRRCLDLAGKAEGMTYPNPVVGSVIVNSGTVIGEGFHLKTGEPHAEVNAINSVKDGSLLNSSTLYVNLEPCSHHGRTPPCAELIIARGIRKVVVGTKDTSGKVAGKGIKMLRDAGCEVFTGVMENECRWINRRFFCFNEFRRPYIILKWAQSADGYIDINRKAEHAGSPVWISGKPERALVHKWRATEQAILTGANTMRMDNPRLDVRDWAGDNPLRLVLSSSGQIDFDSALFKINGTNIVFTHNSIIKQINGLKVALDKNRASARQVADYLFNEGIQSVIIEGGREVLDHFISTGLWDEARIFHGKDEFREGIRAPEISGKVLSIMNFNRSILEIVKNELAQQPERVDINN